MKKHNVNVESVVVTFVMLTMLVLVFVGVICTSLFLFLYRRAGLRDVRPPVYDGRRACQQGKRSLHTGSDHRNDETENEKSVSVNRHSSHMSGSRNPALDRNRNGSEPDEDRKPFYSFKNPELGIWFFRTTWTCLHHLQKRSVHD